MDLIDSYDQPFAAFDVIVALSLYQQISQPNSKMRPVNRKEKEKKTIRKEFKTTIYIIIIKMASKTQWKSFSITKADLSERNGGLPTSAEKDIYFFLYVAHMGRKTKIKHKTSR